MSCKHCEQGRYIVSYEMRINMLQKTTLLLFLYLVGRQQ